MHNIGALLFLFLHQLFFLLIAPSGFSLIGRVADNEVCISFILGEEDPFVGHATVFRKIPDARVACSLATVLRFIHQQVGLAFVLAYEYPYLAVAPVGRLKYRLGFCGGREC